MMVTFDGGQDENPRYEKTIECAIDYFTSFDLDALLIAPNAPGRSAFNGGGGGVIDVWPHSVKSCRALFWNISIKERT